MENYKEKYEQAIERCKKEFNFNNLAYSHEEIKQRLENVFPELKESDDEQIKNEIIDYLKGFIPHHNDDLVAKSKLWITWLEKQGEQKTVSKTEPIIEGLTTEFQKQVSYLIASAINKEHEYTKGYVEWVTQSLLGYAKNEQTSTDKIESKFKIGDWITIDNPCQIISIDGNYIVQYCDDEETREISKKFCEFQFHLWTIQDATDGDVISFNDGHGNDCIELIKSITGKKIEFWFCLTNGNCYEVFDGIIPYTNFASRKDATPATKEQRDLLFSKMKEAGYEWDAEKKELKKMKQKTTKLPNGEDYGIDSLYHAARILEKTLGEVEGYQSDDGILEHKCAIEAVNRLYKQKPAWSEEDESMLQNILECLKNGWSKLPTDILKYESWLKSLKERYTWKPSDEQMEALLKLEEMHVLEHEKNQENAHLYMVIKNIREQLQKLRKE